MRLLVFITVILVSSVFSQHLFVIHIKSNSRQDKRTSGQPLYINNSLNKRQDTEFFSGYRIYKEGDTFPQSSDILSIDTVSFLHIEPLKKSSLINAGSDHIIADPSKRKVKVGIIDTGIDFDHPQVGPYLFINSKEDINNNGRLDVEDINGLDEDGNGYIDDVSGYDFVDTPENPDFGDYLDPDPMPNDEYPGGHGTGVAHQAIIASKFSASIVNLRAGSASGFLREDIVAQALYYAYQNNIAIINMSFGDRQMATFLIDLIEFLSQQGIVFIASAGNSKSTDLHFPSSLSSVLSVGSFNKSGYRSGFSNFGYFIDLYAPGENIELAKPGGGTGTFSGTSFSAPVVSGGLAKVWADNPDLLSTELTTNALLMCEDKGTAGWDFDNSNGLFLPSDDFYPIHSRLSFNRPQSQQEFFDSVLVTITCAGFGTGIKGLYLAGMESQNNEFELVKKIIDQSDSVWVKTPEEGKYVLKLAWNDGANQRNIELHQQIILSSTVPKINSWRLISSIEGVNKAYILKVNLDQMGKIRFNSKQTKYESSAADSISYLLLNPGFNLEYTENTISSFNPIGESEPIQLPDIHFSSLLTGSFDTNTNSLLKGNGYIWPEKLGDLFAATLFDDLNGFSNLHLYDRNSGTAVFSFDQPWIIRDMLWLNTDTVRILMGFGDASQVVDYSLKQNLLIGQWQFNSLWAVNFIGTDVLMRKNSYFQIYRKSTESWDKIFTFDQHNEKTQFSVPAAAYIDDFIAFGDVTGVVYIYKKIAEDNYQYKYQIDLEGIDPANLLVSWSINKNDTLQNSLWCLSMVEPDNISEANSNAKYWALEGFEIDNDKSTRIAANYFNGVAPRGKKWPAMGIVRVENNNYLSLHIFPESYFFSFSDSLTLVHANLGLPSWYDYALFSSDGTFLTNSDDGNIVEVNFSNNLSLPMVKNIQWQIPDSTHILFRWDGLKNAQYKIREESSGNIINSNQPMANIPILGIPNTTEIRIQQLVLGKTSPWSEPAVVSVSRFPELAKADYFANGFIKFEFDQPVKLIEGQSLFIPDSGKFSSTNQIASEKILLKYSLPERGDVVVNISNLLSDQNVLYTREGISLQQNVQNWQPEVNVTAISNNRFLLQFAGQFNREDLLTRGNYSIYPQGEVLSLNWQNLNEIELVAGEFAALGYDYQLQVLNIVDVNGNKLKQTSFLLPQPRVTNLKNIAIYPQPLNYKKHKQLVISGLTEEAEIDVYSSDGRYISQISGRPLAQKMVWDLKNNSGEIVGSGIYLLVIRNNSGKQIKKVMIIR